MPTGKAFAVTPIAPAEGKVPSLRCRGRRRSAPDLRFCCARPPPSRGNSQTNFETELPEDVEKVGYVFAFDEDTEPDLESSSSENDIGDECDGSAALRGMKLSELFFFEE
mmetsp:Transcript_2568/g.5949  ORF Transcript_2568/g.5949 Transcript_2568/m.5949 type:complete len:110 (-) Transcript_2568:365-694(-)|eukprot:CAMPEP_0170607664 /NCGR_PEP_ID=MMETSP0224-20130122/21174_1 /TAXON_ID=285029 /ORGANISM="Togula jolla, Strain CCCM 725" /LENGTH=109 /DNA_ID=CAMNT_0010932843 /DNA_START=42 /DNA_END=371 /DNA_ORIENTATION=+